MTSNWTLLAVIALGLNLSPPSLPARTAQAPPPPQSASSAARPQAPAGAANDQQAPPQAQEPLRVQVQLVNVFATVRDNHKAIVPNLTADNFRVYENGALQKISYFAREVTLPLTLGILIDTSLSQQRLLGPEQISAKRFLKRVLRPHDEAMVISFDLDVDLLADFTEDQDVLDNAIQRTRINANATPMMVQGPFPTGNKGTDFYDAVYLACNEKLSSEAGRKALIILTDAEDFGSKLKLSDAIEAAQHTDTVVHILLIADPGQYGGSYEGAGVAKKLTEETGGRVIEVRGGRNLEAAFDEISEELRSQYVIGYYSTNPARDGTFRKIKVDTTPDHLHVLARRGYYAPKN